MRYLMTLALAVVMFSGCGLFNSRFLKRDFEVGKVMESPVGGTMIRAQSGFRNDVHKSVIVGQQCELVYGGFAHGVVKITYREFDLDEGGVTHVPAYSQDLQYDLNDSHVITFRKTMIEVLQAANDKIVFKVLDDPDPSEYD